MFIAWILVAELPHLVEVEVTRLTFFFRGSDGPFE